MTVEQDTEDRRYIISTYSTIHGKNPSAWEVDHILSAFRSGQYTRDTWTRDEQANDADATVQRIFKQVVGADRPANDPGIQFYASRLRSGNMTVAQVEAEMRGSTSQLLRNANPEDPGPSPDQEDSRSRMSALLKSYGLESLSDWAWQEIQAGNSIDRVIQDLRERPEYKARFPGMDQRRANGVAPINESQYIEFERRTRDTMRRFGMPPGFWDDPTDFTSFIANDVSAEEIQTRIEDGWTKITTAPPAVRQVFQQWFGVEGDTALAAWFIDPSKATPLILKAADTARTAGFATLFGMDLSQNRANQLYDFGKSSDQAIQAFGQVSRLAPLFSETVSEHTDLTAEQEGLDAALGLNGTAENTLERRGRTRVAATSGGGGANVTSRGIGGGTAE